MNFSNTINGFNKSIFNKQTYSKSTAGEKAPYNISIMPLDGDTIGVRGVLQEPLNLNLSPEWETIDLGSIVSNVGAVQSLFEKAINPMKYAGTSISNAGATTEKFFVKSSYTEISPKFRVVDWNGNGQPLLSAFKLSNLVLPERSNELSIQFEELTKALKAGFQTKGIDWFKNKFGEIGDMVNNPMIANALDQVTNVLEGVYDFFTEYGFNPEKAGKSIEAEKKVAGVRKLFSSIGEGIKAKKNREFMLTQAPPAVMVKIGSYFEHTNMVVQDLSMEFSKEVTVSGPLYLDVDISLSSKTAPMVGGDSDNSIGFKKSTKRVNTQTNKSEQKIGNDFTGIIGNTVST